MGLFRPTLWVKPHVGWQKKTHNRSTLKGLTKKNPLNQSKNPLLIH